jgi:hypothetical protein
MKLDIRVIMKHGLDEANHVTGSLTGKITEVGGLPTDKQLKRSSSFVSGKRCSCNDHANCDFTQSGTRAEILKKYHCLHGQEVKGVVSLPEQYQNLDPLKHFFRGTKKKYEVTLRCNDNQQNMVSYNNNIAPCTLVFYSKKNIHIEIAKHCHSLIFDMKHAYISGRCAELPISTKIEEEEIKGTFRLIIVWVSTWCLVCNIRIDWCSTLLS